MSGVGRLHACGKRLEHRALDVGSGHCLGMVLAAREHLERRHTLVDSAPKSPGEARSQMLLTPPEQAAVVVAVEQARVVVAGRHGVAKAFDELTQRCPLDDRSDGLARRHPGERERVRGR